jgi:hypothetical protein
VYLVAIEELTIIKEKIKAIPEQIEAREKQRERRPTLPETDDSRQAGVCRKCKIHITFKRDLTIPLSVF